MTDEEVVECTEKTLENLISDALSAVFDEYGFVIALLIIGFFLGWNGKRFLADRKYNKQILIRLGEKDQRIAELNFLVSERLNEITVPEINKSLFKKIKKYFRNKYRKAK